MSWSIQVKCPNCGNANAKAAPNGLLWCASSMKRQKLYANAARILLKWGKLAQARHMLHVWHNERTLWAHLVGVAV